MCEKVLTVVRPCQVRNGQFQTTCFSATAHVALSFFVRSDRQDNEKIVRHPADYRRMQTLARTMSLRSIAASRTRVTPILPPVVHLNEVEHKLCSLLDEFVQHLEQQDGIQTTCRFAGGWVRDKV